MTGNIVSSVDLTVSFGGKRCETFMRSMTVRTVYGTLTYLVNGLTRKDMKAKADACNISFLHGKANACRASRADAVLYRRHER